MYFQVWIYLIIAFVAYHTFDSIFILILLKIRLIFIVISVLNHEILRYNHAYMAS